VEIKIVKNSKIWLGISSVLVILSIAVLITKGFNYGIDFAGGNVFQLQLAKNSEEFQLKEFNKALDEISQDISQLNSSTRRVQEEKNSKKATVVIKTPEMTEETKSVFLEELKSNYGEYKILRSEKVGATIGNELKSNAIVALILGALIILLYIKIRFATFIYGFSALVALLHDVIIAVGFIAFLGYEINTPFIAAVLTILGYSINDTIVIFDRIRENRKKFPGDSYGEVIDLSINQTLLRSFNTSFTTFLAVMALLIFGGATLQTFITALAAGVLVGTYSSIFVASPVAYLLESKMKKKAIENIEKNETE